MKNNIAKRLLKMILFGIAALIMTQGKAQSAVYAGFSILPIDKDFHSYCLYAGIAILLYFATD